MRTRLGRLVFGEGRLSVLLPYLEGAGGILLLTAFFLYFYGGASLLYPGFHPFLIVVLLVAGRYGFAPGLFSALFATFVDYLLLVWQNHGESLSPRDFSFLWPSAFLFSGMILGEMRDAEGRKYRELEGKFRKLEEEARTAQFERDVLARAKKELERRIFLEPNAVSDLFDVFRSLEKDEAESLSASLLSLATSFAGADSAALYRKERRKFRLDLEAGHGRVPRETDLGYPPFSRAFESGEAVTLRSHGILPEALLPGGEKIRPVGVWPILGGEEDPEMLLVVWHAPFERLLPEFFQTLGMIADRAGARLRFLRSQSETREAIATDPETGFLRPLFFARRSAEELGKSLRYGAEISFLFLTFSSRGGEEADFHAALMAMREVVRQLLRDVDLTGISPDRSGVAFALPHTGEAGAEVVLRKVRDLWSEKKKGSPLILDVELGSRRESFLPGQGQISQDSYERIMARLDRMVVFDPSARVWGEEGFARIVDRERREAHGSLGLLRLSFSSPSWEEAVAFRRALDRIRSRGGGRLFPPELQAGLSLDGRSLWLLFPGATPERMEESRTALEELWREADSPKLKRGAFLLEEFLLVPGEDKTPPLFAELAQASVWEEARPRSGEKVSGEPALLPEGSGEGDAGPEDPGLPGGAPLGDLPEAVEALAQSRGKAGMTRRDLAMSSPRFARLPEEAQTALLETLVRQGRLVLENAAGQEISREVYSHSSFRSGPSDG